MKYFFRKKFFPLPKILLNSLLLPIYLLLFLSSKIFNIKFEYLNCLRIGHMIPDGFKSYYLSLDNNRNKRFKVIYVVDFWTCNISLRNYFQELIPIVKIISIFRTINFYMPSFLKLIGNNNKLTTARDPYNLYRKYKPKPFPIENIERSKKELFKNGWEKEPLTTLIIRDNSYLENHNSLINNSVDWSYHDYRNSGISCYEKLINHITEGSFVARVGKSSYETFNKGPRRFDFTKIKKPDYFDYIIPTLSKCIISTGTGIDSIGFVYNIPIMFVNSLPIALINSSSNVYQVPKKLYYLDNQKELNLKDYIKSCYIKTEDYTKNGIGIRNISGIDLIEYYEEFSSLFLSERSGIEAYDNLTMDEKSFVNEFYSLRFSLVADINDISIDKVYRNAFPSPLWLRRLKIETN